MKNWKLNLFICLLLWMIQTPPSAAVTASRVEVATPTSIFDLPMEDLLQLDTKALSEKLGRDLTRKEKRLHQRLQKRKRQTTSSANAKGKMEKVAISGFVFGLLSFLPVIGIPFGIAGIVLSSRASKKIRANPERRGRRMARAGLILSVTGIVFSFATFVYLIFTNLELGISAFGAWG